MAHSVFRTKPLCELMLAHYYWEFESKYKKKKYSTDHFEIICFIVNANLN